MIWSIIKLVLGTLYMYSALLVNIIKWLLYFGWDKTNFVLFWTDKKNKYTYHYNGNVFAWAFKIRRYASSIDIYEETKRPTHNG